MPRLVPLKKRNIAVFSFGHLVTKESHIASHSILWIPLHFKTLHSLQISKTVKKMSPTAHTMYQ